MSTNNEGLIMDFKTEIRDLIVQTLHDQKVVGVATTSPKYIVKTFTNEPDLIAVINPRSKEKPRGVGIRIFPGE